MRAFGLDVRQEVHIWLPLSSSPSWNLVSPDLVDLFQSLTFGLWEEEQHVDEHADTEGSVDDVSLPCNVLESGWSEHGNSKVENPVTRSGKRGTSLSRSRVTPDFRTVQPDSNTPRVSEGADEQVATSDNTLSSTSTRLRNLQSNSFITTDRVHRLSIGSQDTSNTELEGHHKSSTRQQDKSTTNLIQKVQSWNSDNDVQHVLNGGSNQVSVTRVTSHLENVHNVVHHNVHTSQLLPDLSTHGSDSSWKVLLGEQVGVSEVLNILVNHNLFLNFGDFDQDVWVLSVTMSLDFGNNLLSIIPVALLGQPSWRLRNEEKTKQQDQAWNNLDTPSDSEGSNAINLRATVRNVEHNHDTQGN